MHRCLLPHALPARARCVPNFLALKNRPPPFPWRQTLPLRRFSTATEERRPDERAAPLDSYGSNPSENTSSVADRSQESQGEQEGNDDALDFILEGYEAQPARSTGAARRARIVDSLSAYEAYMEGQKSQAAPKRRTGRSGPARTRSVMKKPKTHSRKPKKQLPKTIPRRYRLEHALRQLPRVPSLWARPRWVSITSMSQTSAHALSRVWNHNYAMAQNVYDSHQREGKVMQDTPMLDPHAPDWVEAVAQRMAENQDLDLKSLASEHDMNAHLIWAHIALWMLHHDKDCLVEFLLATASSAPGLWVADCLQVLVAHYTKSQGDDTVQQIQKLHKIFCTFAESPNGQRTEFDGRFVRLLLPYCTPAQVSDMYRAIRLGELRIHRNTLMHLTTYFAKHDHFHQALNVLLDAHAAGAPVRSYAFRSNCTTLLRKSMDQPGGLRVCLRIVDNLVKIGVHFNTRLCNIIILNAVEAGDLKTAHDIYHSLAEHNMKPDVYTFAILLKGCKHDIDNADALQQTITAAIEKVGISKNAILPCEILHCLALHHTRNNGETAWPTICEAYAEIYELEPMARLGLPMPPTIISNPRAKTPRPAPAQAIGIMLRTYLQLAIDGRLSTTRLQNIYKHYQQLVATDTQPFSSTAKSTHCYNAFLAAFTKRKSTLIDAAGVIKDMQKGAAASPPTSPAPDVQSWSIFLHGFTQHGKMALAEQVLTHMRKQGLEPNTVTWNTLLSGHAGQQNYEGTLDAMLRLDATGMAWDEFTYGGLRRFRDSVKLKELTDRRGGNFRLDFTSDLKHGLGARLNEAAHEAAEVAG